MSDRPAPMNDSEHRLLSHFLSPGTVVTEATMGAVHAYRDEVLREAAVGGSEDVRLDVSARTGEDGVLHVSVRDGGRVYELQGRPVVEIEELHFPVDEWSRSRFVLRIPDAQQVTARMVPVDDVVAVPREVLAGLVRVAQHVSAGKSAAFSQDRPYPDATARFALGALDEAGLLYEFMEEQR